MGFTRQKNKTIKMPSFSPDYFRKTTHITEWLVIAACISINLPTAYMTVSHILLVSFWLISGNYQHKYTVIKQNPIALASLILLGAYITGVIYSSAPLSERLSGLSHYYKLLLIPVIISVLHEPKIRRLAINAFLFSSIAVLVISYLKWLQVIPHTQDIEQGYIVFKNRIAGSIFMVFCSYLMLFISSSSQGYKKYLWLTIYLLATYQIFFLITGKTGQLLTVILLIWFALENWNKKIIQYLLIIVLAVAVILQFQPEFKQPEITVIKDEISNHNQNLKTSSGFRLEFYKQSLVLIKSNLLFGTGTGSFAQEYAASPKPESASGVNTVNPHNQFLLTAVELGVAGLLVLLGFFYIAWKYSYDLPDPLYGKLARGLILTTTIGSLFNSLLFDTSEGKFYCILIGVLFSTYKNNQSPFNYQACNAATPTARRVR